MLLDRQTSGSLAMPEPLKTQFKAVISFGTENAAYAGQAEWSQLEHEPHEAVFDTEAELIAYLKGIDDAIGWLECHVFDEWEVDSYNEWKSQKNKDKANPPG